MTNKQNDCLHTISVKLSRCTYILRFIFLVLFVYFWWSCAVRAKKRAISKVSRRFQCLASVLFQMFFQRIFKGKFLVTMRALKWFSGNWMSKHVPVQLVLSFGLVWTLWTRKRSISMFGQSMFLQFRQRFETLRAYWTLFAVQSPFMH